MDSQVGYVDRNLKEDERLIYRSGYHWATLLGPAMLMVIGGLAIRSKGITAVVLLFLGVLWGLLSSVSVQSSEMAVTNRRLFGRMGFPWRRTFDIPLREIEYADFYAPSLGVILNFGKLMVYARGRRKMSLRMVRNPMEMTRQIAEALVAVRKEDESSSSPGPGSS